MTTDAGSSGAPRFDVVLRGYDRRQVDEHVARLQRANARMRADLELARSQPIPVVPKQGGGYPAPGQQGPPGARPRPTPRPRPGGPVPPGESPDMIGSFTDRMQSILQAAEDEAAEIRKKAHAAARAEQETVRAQLADMVRQRDAVLAELTRMRGQLEGLLAAPTARIILPPREGAPAPVRQRDGSGTPQPGPASPPPAGGPAPGGPAPGGPAPGGRGPGSPSPAPAGRGPGTPPADGGPARPGPVPSRAPGAPARSGSAPTGGPGGGDPSANRSAPPDAHSGPKAEPAALQGDARNVSSAATRGEAGASAPSGADRSSSSSPGKSAAHRLPSGGYHSVGTSVEQSGSMRPSTEPEPEPGDLFRPVPGHSGDGPQGSERTTAVQGVRPPDNPGPGSGTGGQGRTTGPVDSTVKVNSVRPTGGPDAARQGPPAGPGPNRGEQKNPRSDEAKDGLRSDAGPGGAGGSDRSGRSPSASRSG
jgi:hypothetical protein